LGLLSVKPLLYLLLILVIAALLFLVWQLWRQRTPPLELADQRAAVVPDLSDEQVFADALPANEWLVLARQHLEQGELTLALRAFYLASLALLAQQELITVAKFKSNRDYQRELQRRAHSHPALLAIFAENVDVFERAWYGMHEIDRPAVERFGQNYERIAHHEPAS
jgi:hypothetical protein